MRTVHRPAASSHTLYVREGTGTGVIMPMTTPHGIDRPNVRWEHSNLRFQIQLYCRISFPLLFQFYCKQN